MRGLGIAKGFDKSRAHGWFVSVRAEDGRRPKQYFPTAQARDKAFNAKLLEIRTHGAEAAKPIGTAERQALAEMVRRAGPTGLTILEIFNRGLSTVSGSISSATLTVGQAATTFLAEQKARLNDGRISAVREKEVRGKLGRYVTTWGHLRLSACDRRNVKAYLAEIPGEPQTRINHARVLRFFFNWAIAENLADKNPVPTQEGVDRIPTTFSNAQVAALFEAAWRDVPELVPVLGLQWFAGLRPGASHLLQWQDIDFDRRRILIQPHANKLRQPDVVQDLPLTVFGLLLPFRGSGRICPANYRKMGNALHRAVGFTEGDWPEDVARHTFASNLFSLYEQDSRRVEAVMLHASSAMLRKHYLLKNVPRESAEAYFSAHLPSA